MIEPCCAQRNLLRVRDAIKNGGTARFHGYGDLSLTELLPAILVRYSETELMIVAPTLPDQAAEVIEKWMRKQWARADGKGKLDVIRHLTVIANLSRRKSPVAHQWKRENPFGERLTLIDRQQADTAILLPDFAITGPVNMRYGEHFTATATTELVKVAELWERFAEAGNEENGDNEANEPNEANGPAGEAAGTVGTAGEAAGTAETAPAPRDNEITE